SVGARAGGTSAVLRGNGPRGARTSGGSGCGGPVRGVHPANVVRQLGSAGEFQRLAPAAASRAGVSAGGVGQRLATSAGRRRSLEIAERGLWRPARKPGTSR